MSRYVMSDEQTRTIEGLAQSLINKGHDPVKVAVAVANVSYLAGFANGERETID